MTFEIFVFRAQSWAMGLQTKKPGNVWNALQIAFGGLTTQILMQLCFVKILTEGQRQCQQQKNAKSASKK
jgi:hypothetical protein